MNAEKNPTINVKKLVSDIDMSPDNISCAIFPKINGMTIKNEKRADFSLSTPNNTDVEIVAPDLEIPGIIAIACDIPISIASLTPTFFSADIFDFQRLTLAPILLSVGFIIQIFAIMYKEKARS